jgi:sec-independent protein translocase protein TatB
MFDIGGPEFLVIAVIALVVIGPERLPKVMGQVGRGYRQLRNMSDELLREAREQWAVGMQEVENVSSSIQGTWDEATNSLDTLTALPPPAAYQVPAAIAQPSTAAEAGPWMLPAYHRETAADVELLGTTFPEMPTALPRRLPAIYDPALDDSGIGGPSLMGPAATEEELAAMAYDLPEDQADTRSPAAPAEAVPVETVNGATAPHVGTEDAEDAELPELPAGAYAAAQITTSGYIYTPSETATNGTYAPESEAELPPEPATPVTNGVAHDERAFAPASRQPGDEESAEEIRERTIVDLYRKGGISLESASQFLGVEKDEFLAWVELAGGVHRTTDAAPLA